MVTRAVSDGRGIDGLMSYLMHDKVTPGDRYPTTAERVAWAVPIGGSPTADVDLCVRIMQGVTADAAILKQLSGASNRGRKLRNPYAHFMTSWPPGETPSREEMLEAAGGQLEALECADRLVIVVAHTDTEHHHFHLVVCKVHPETGKAASLDHSGLKLSHFAEQWERDHGGIVIENRVRRNEARAARAAYVDRYMEENYKPDPEASMRDQAVLYDETLKKARAEAGKLHRLPPMERKRSRNVDGQPVKTPEPVRQIWDDLYEKQRAENLPEPDQRKQRVEASCLQRHGPAPRVDQEPEVIVPGVPSQAFPAPSRAVRVGREPEVIVPGVPSQAFPAPSRAVRVGREPEVAVPGVPSQAFPAPSRAVRVGREPEVAVPGVPSQAFPAPSRAVRVGREPEVAVPAAPEQPCPIPVRDTAVQVLADLCAQALRTDEPEPEPVYPDRYDVEPLLDDLADKIKKDYPGAPWLETERVIGERHFKEQKSGALDEMAERRQGCEKAVIDRLVEYDVAQAKPPGPVPQEYGTVERWVHALADLIQTLVRKLFTKQRDDRIDSKQGSTPADDRIDSGQERVTTAAAPLSRPSVSGPDRLRAAAEQMGVELPKELDATPLTPNAGKDMGAERPARRGPARSGGKKKTKDLGFG